MMMETDESIIRYEFVVRLDKNAGHKVIREDVWVNFPESDRAKFHLGIKNGRVVAPHIKRPNHLSEEVFAAFIDRIHDAANISDGTGLAFPLTSVLQSLSFLGSDKPFDHYLSLARAFDKVELFLNNMRFYHIFPDALREPQMMSSKYPLDEHGENLASVLADMKVKKSTYMPEPISVLGQVVPGVKDISVTRAGGHLVIGLLHQEGADSEKGIWLDASQESDGTLRTLGLLVALYLDPTPPFIAIEEPELTIHPGALSILADVISETSHRAAVLVTTHSPELLDSLHITWKTREYRRRISASSEKIRRRLNLRELSGCRLSWGGP